MAGEPTQTGSGRTEALGADAADGLPERDAWLTVLRDGFASDGLDPAGLYFGTRTGELFASADEGGHWRALAEWLPPVVCVKAAVVR